jgi:hypothetical protein
VGEGEREGEEGGGRGGKGREEIEKIPKFTINEYSGKRQSNGGKQRYISS